MLGLTSQYHGPSTITAWSSGTGFAGACRHVLLFVSVLLAGGVEAVDWGLTCMDRFDQQAPTDSQCIDLRTSTPELPKTLPPPPQKTKS
jgi:hypothetical protein